MNHYNPHIHHRRSVRLKNYDYSQEGLYFITLCCHNRISLFGHIENGEMLLNECGQIAYDEWINTAHIRTNIELGEFIIMPNHMHAIIHISSALHGTGVLHTPSFPLPSLHTPSLEMLSLPIENSEKYNLLIDNSGKYNSPIGNSGERNSLIENKGECNSPLLRSPSQTVGAIVRGYKSAVTKQLTAMGIIETIWQRNFYEHIIRNQQSCLRISDYIIHNPQKWNDDGCTGPLHSPS